LRRHMRVTWFTFLIGTLALIGTPGFAGFYSKDSILEAVGHSTIPGSGFAYFAVTAGVFVTAFYSFRLYFLVFHGKERFGAHGDDHHHDAGHEDAAHGAGDGAHAGAHAGAPHESPAVVTVPLVMLAIPSVVIGFVGIRDMLFSDYFSGSIFVNAQAHPAMSELAREFEGPAAMALDGLTRLPLLLAAAGAVLAWFLYLKRPDLPAKLRARFGAIYALLDNKYYMDIFNEVVIARGARLIGQGLWKGGDVAVIDGAVNGSARLVGWIAGVVRRLQSGYIYHYAFAMLVGLGVVLFAFLTWPYAVGAAR
jgi:NADH-quinone oxidoreductase subunit L